MGFWVAMTMKGLGSLWLTPPIVVWRSCMASSMADWVFAEERLISSRRTMLAWTGPSWVTISPRSWFQIWEPTMSLGIRSGVHWMRRNVPDTADARVCAAVVFAKPGTDSTRTWPPASSEAVSARRRPS